MKTLAIEIDKYHYQQIIDAANDVLKSSYDEGDWSNVIPSSQDEVIQHAVNAWIGSGLQNPLPWTVKKLIADYFETHVRVDASSGKELSPPEKTQKSLLNLRNELASSAWPSPDLREIVFKINSCLFSEYPHGK